LNLPRLSSKNIRVLYIDDEEDQLAMMKEILPSFDKEIIIDSICNPEKVPLKLQQTWYDCLIIDYKMPELSGINLITIIRKHNDVPIILYTGKGNDEVAAEGFAEGITDYVKKEATPQHYQILAKRIRYLVERYQTNELYYKMIIQSKDAIVITTKSEIIFANQAMADLVGEELEKILGKNGYNYLKDNSEKIAREDFEKLEKGEKYNIIADLEVTRKDGKKIQVESNSSLIMYKGQNAILAVVRDVTHRRLLEKEIIRSEEKYRSLVDLAPDGIATISFTGEVLWVNNSFSTLTGFSQEELVGKNLLALGTIRPIDMPKFVGLFLDVLKGRDIPQIEFNWVNKTGKVGWAEAKFSVIDNELTKKKEILAIIRDITDRKAMEEKIKNYTHEIELLAEKRAKKLLESEKMIAVGTIASTVTHDLRGPLNTIRNAVYLMEKKPEKTAEMREVIVKTIDNASKMLSEIKEKWNEEKLEIKNIEVKDFIESIIAETPITPNIEIQMNLQKIFIDIDQLKIRRVIENLVRNAMDATPGKGVISISNKNEDGYIVIEVKDTGAGIPEEILNNLFQPFYTTKSTGTGLGLYNCKKIIEAHGGSIKVKSILGSGSTFILSFPIKKTVVLMENPSIIIK
jgi:PAS domain S-box-containing protein